MMYKGIDEAEFTLSVILTEIAVAVVSYIIPRYHFIIRVFSRMHFILKLIRINDGIRNVYGNLIL